MHLQLWSCEWGKCTCFLFRKQGLSRYAKILILKENAKKKKAFTFTSVHRTITKTQLEWLLLLRMRWVTTWAYPMTLKTVSAAPRQRKEAASCLRAWGEFSFTRVKKKKPQSTPELIWKLIYCFPAVVIFFSSIVYPELFSSCSQQQLSRFLDQVNPACLLDSPSTDRIFGGPVCGNAFLEPGEECDCGSVEVCACSPNA